MAVHAVNIAVLEKKRKLNLRFLRLFCCAISYYSRTSYSSAITPKVSAVPVIKTTASGWLISQERFLLLPKLTETDRSRPEMTPHQNGAGKSIRSNDGTF